MNDHRPRFVCLLCMPSFCCLRWRCFARCVSGLRPDSERGATPARHCAAYSMASVKETSPQLGKIVEKISGFRRAGAINISCRQAQSRAGAIFLSQHPNRHATWWKCAPCECQRELSVGKTDDRHEADERRGKNLPLAAHHKSPCFDHLRSRREKIRPAVVRSD